MLTLKTLGKIPFLPLPSFWQLLSVFGIPWFPAVLLQSVSIFTWSFTCVHTCVSSHGILFFVCLCPNVSLFIMAPIVGLESTLIQYLNFTKSAKPLFQTRLHWQLRRIKTWIYPFGNHNSIHKSIFICLSVYLAIYLLSIYPFIHPSILLPFFI